MPELSHADATGRAKMVDISAKAATLRIATAQAVVNMRPETVRKICQNELPKGDVLAVARVAGILAAKRTDQLIPLCHTLPLADISIDFAPEDEKILIKTRAVTTAQTGVEMEALVAATTAALTLYDMAKAVDKRMIISEVHLLTKTGGKSGDFTWEK